MFSEIGKCMKQQTRIDTRDVFERMADRRYISGPLALIHGFAGYAAADTAWSIYNRIAPAFIPTATPQYYTDNPEIFNSAIGMTSFLALVFAADAAFFAYKFFKPGR